MVDMNKLILILIIISYNLFSLFNPLKEKNDAGIKKYNLKKFGKAIEKFKDAQIDDPVNYKLFYNIGNSYYKSKLYKKSLEFYNKALPNAKVKDQAKLYYNMGNSYFKLNQFDKAILNYVKSLKLNPKDKDAKYNLELSRKKLREQSKKNKKNRSQSQKNKKQKQNQNNKSKKDNKQNDKKNKKQDNKKQNDKNGSKKKKQSKAAKKRAISKKDAEKLLKSLSEKQKKTQKKMKYLQSSPGGYIGKDW